MNCANIGKASPAGASLQDAQLDGAKIDGISVTDLLGFWRVGHGAMDA